MNEETMRETERLKAENAEVEALIAKLEVIKRKLAQASGVGRAHP